MNKTMRSISPLFFGIALILLSVFACNEPGEHTSGQLQSEREQDFVRTMQKHLDAVTNRDLETLRSTMSPTGEMQLILPGSEIIQTVDGFMNYHQDWFSDSTWTFETKILNTKVGEKMGMAITEIVYREPEREGVPYWNRMIVSYDLEQLDGTWYIIKDHASSIQKSTDME